MVKTEIVTINGTDYVRTYSDTNHMLIQDETNNVYSEAIDPIGFNRTYTESDELITETEPEEEQPE